MDPIEPLRHAAISERLGRPVRSDRLIETALDAVLAGVDGPALAELAGLSRTEEPEAHDLFDRVIDELGLAPTLPADPTVARWELVRWWCLLIVEGELSPEEGGRLIWLEGWEELDYPDALQSLVGEVSEWEDWTEDWSVPRSTYRDGIVEAAKQLLEGSWPPPARQ